MKKETRNLDEPWQKIFDDLELNNYPFNKPYILTHEQIKKSTSSFKRTGQREVRLLTYQAEEKLRPKVFTEKGLFILPISNKSCVIIKGEGYLKIEPIATPIKNYNPKIDFELITSLEGNSEMQHLDYAYAQSLIRTFMDDETLCLTIRGRKRITREFSFKVGNFFIKVNGAQIEVDGGYEGKDKIVLIEAKPWSQNNICIRQLYYPFRKWSDYLKDLNINKKIYNLLFQKDNKHNICSIWQFEFTNPEDYNSIKLIRSCQFQLPKS